ncbi:MAG: anti-sigma factor family protein [Blastocatellia bacterium]
MAEHLSQQMLERYRRRTLSVTELPRADEHLATCAACRAQLGELEAVSALAGFFRRDAETFIAHLDYEQLEAYVQGRLPAVEKQSVEQHLRDCTSCQRESEDLRAFAVEFDARPITRLAPEAPQSLWQRLMALPRQINFALPAWQWAGATAAIVLLIAVVTFFVRRSEPDQNIVVVPTPSPIVTPPPTPGTTPLLAPSPALPNETLPPQVDLALRNERLKVPAEIAGLAGRTGNLMGGGTSEETVVLTAPAATFINTEKPTLRWQPLAGATRYSVRVTNQDFDKVAEAEDLSATQWTLPSPLARGQMYSWQITAHRDDKEILSPSTNFQVLDKTKAAALAAAQKNFGANHLVMGVLYAEAGLLDDAAREFQAEMKAGPQSAKARKLLQNLRAQRQSLTTRPQPK